MAEPQSAACRNALDVLQARETQLATAAATPASAVPPRGDPRWQALRRAAVRACLGREGVTLAPPTASARPPIAVPPVTLPAPERTTAPRAMSPTAPLAQPRPDARATPPTGPLGPCDALGCWTGNGQRVPIVGRNPLEPRVQCTLQGRVAVCL